MKLIYTRRAANELAAILDYIAERSPQGARHVQFRIQEMIGLLLAYPHAGVRTSNARLRRLVAYPYPYLIFYEATEDAIIVHGVRHSARKS